VYLPAPPAFVGKNCNHVFFQGKVFHPHNFQIGNNPVYRFAGQGNAQAHNIFNGQGNGRKSVVGKILRAGKIRLAVPFCRAFFRGQIGFPQIALVVVAVGTHRIQHKVQVADGAFTGKVPALVAFQPLNHHKSQVGIHRSAVAPPGFVKIFVGKGKRRKRVRRAKKLRIGKFRDDLSRFFIIGNLGEQRPVTGDGFYRQPSFTAVNVMVKAVVGVPHQGVDSGFKGEILFLVLKAGILVIENIRHRGHIQGINRHHGVKIQRIIGSLAGGVSHSRNSQGNPVQAVGFLKG